MTLLEYRFKSFWVSKGSTDYGQDRNVIMFNSVYHSCRFAGRHSNNLAALLMSEVVRRSRYMNVALESLIREIPRESLQIKMRKWDYIISWTRGLRGSSCRALGMPDLHEMRRENAEWENSNAVEIGREKEKKKCPGLVDLPVRLFFCFYVLPPCRTYTGVILRACS